jgi:hypothetical protein
MTPLVKRPLLLPLGTVHWNRLLRAEPELRPALAGTQI